MKIVFKLILGGIIYLISTILSGLVFPMKEEFTKNIPPNEVWFIIPSIIIVGCIFTIVLYFFSSKSRLPTVKKIIILSVIFFFTTTVMSQIETWYFRAAFPLVDSLSMIKLFLSGLLTTAIYIPTIVLIFKHELDEKSYQSIAQKVNPLQFLFLIILYVGVYFFFGKYIAYSSEELRNFYFGWHEIADSNNYLWLFQVFRGGIWVILAWIIINQFKLAKDAIIGITCFFAISLSILLIIPNVLMPAEVRLFHGIELFLSMMFYGIVCGFVLTRKLRIFR